VAVERWAVTRKGRVLTPSQTQKVDRHQVYPKKEEMKEENNGRPQHEAQEMRSRGWRKVGKKFCLTRFGHDPHDHGLVCLYMVTTIRVVSRHSLGCSAFLLS
jgi:hypothetical protein